MSTTINNGYIQFVKENSDSKMQNSLKKSLTRYFSSDLPRHSSKKLTLAVRVSSPQIASNRPFTQSLSRCQYGTR